MSEKKDTYNTLNTANDSTMSLRKLIGSTIKVLILSLVVLGLSNIVAVAGYGGGGSSSGISSNSSGTGSAAGYAFSKYEDVLNKTFYFIGPSKGYGDVECANSIVKLDGPSGVFSTKTDSDGYWNINNIPSGYYLVTINGNETENTCTITSGQTTTIFGVKRNYKTGWQ